MFFSHSSEYSEIKLQANISRSTVFTMSEKRSLTVKIAGVLIILQTGHKLCLLS